MGLPDLPGQPEDDSNFTMDQNNAVHLEPFSEDESDNESVVDANGYAGYQPLNMDDQIHSNRTTSLIEDEQEPTDGLNIPNDEPTGTDAVNTINTELLNVDVWNAPRPKELSIEIDSSKAAEGTEHMCVWVNESSISYQVSLSCDFPNGTGVCEFIAAQQNITLPFPVPKAGGRRLIFPGENVKPFANIVYVMAGIMLPITAVPDWARGVPEEEWKENLLQRIRQRQQPDVDDGCSTSSTGNDLPAAANGKTSHASSRT